MMLAYNHERFIAQALDSAVEQDVNFAYEIVIGEDCSTDGTREIVKRYRERYPEKIRLLLPEKNLGARENSRQTMASCRGEYIAILEGDDYWLSPDKLQKQVDFLDGHSDFSICFHPVRIHYDGMTGKENQIFPENVKSVSTIEDLLEYNFIPSCSVMFRNHLIKELPDSFSNLKMGDWPGHILHAQHGKIKKLNEVMGGYRIHPNGAWSGLASVAVLEGNIEAYRCINAHLGYRYERIIDRRLADHHFRLAALLEEKEDIVPAREHLRYAITHNRSNKTIPRWEWAKMWLRLYLRMPYRIYIGLVGTAKGRNR